MLLLLVLMALHALTASGDIAVVPLPAQYAAPSAGVPGTALSAALSLTGPGSEVATLQTAFARFLAQTLPQYRDSGASAGCSQALPLAATVRVSVANASEAHPALGDDESHTIAVAGASVTIACERVSGCLHALTTLSQLVLPFDFEAGCYALPSPVNITDAPRFTHRGFMLDTARHFYPLPALAQLLDAMALVKMNVLHWHLTDDQSFPVQVPNTRLATAGAFDVASKYSSGDMAAVVELARLRGIRVVPEVDVPGHSGSWCMAHPEICITCPDGSHMLDPSSETTFGLIAQVLATLRASFADSFVHLGGDEVELDCWMANATLHAWILQRHPGLSPIAAAAAEAYGVFVPRVEAIAAAAGFSEIVHWEDAFDYAGATPLCGQVAPALSNKTVVQVFRATFGSSANHPQHGICGVNTTYTTAAAVAAGYRVIYMPPSSWYLSCYADRCDQDGAGAGFEPWTEVYQAEPLQGITTPAQQQLVLGGEVTLWGERLDSASMLAVAFPRAAAAAERLWSPQSTTNQTNARARLIALRERMLALGLPASSVDGGNEASAWGLPSRPSGPGQ